MLAESSYEARLKWFNDQKTAGPVALLTWLDNILKPDSADHTDFEAWYESSRHMQDFVDAFKEMRRRKEPPATITTIIKEIGDKIERIISAFTCFQRDQKHPRPASYRLPPDYEDPCTKMFTTRRAPKWHLGGEKPRQEISSQPKALPTESKIAASIAISPKSEAKAQEAPAPAPTAAKETREPKPLLRSSSQDNLAAYLRQQSSQLPEPPAATAITAAKTAPVSVHDLLRQEATAESKAFRADTPIQSLPELSLPPTQTRSVPPQYNSRARTDLTSRLAAVEAQAATTTTTAESVPAQTHPDKAREALSQMAQRSLSAFTEHLRAPSPTMIHSAPERSQTAATTAPAPLAEKRRPFSLSLPTLSPISAVSAATKSASASPKDRSSITVPAVDTYKLKRSVTPTQKYHSDPVGTADPVTTYHNPIYGQPKKPDMPARPASTSPRRTSISTRPASAADDAVSGCCILSSRRESVPSRTSSSIYASPSRSTPSSPTKPTYLAQAYEELRLAQLDREAADKAADRAQQYRSFTPPLTRR